MGLQIQIKEADDELPYVSEILQTGVGCQCNLHLKEESRGLYGSPPLYFTSRTPIQLS